jgi:16S rRNA (guanine1207-N2)-methyltransferase
VFSHRHIDPGARALIETLAIEPHHHVFDIGCGAGTVTAAAALRATQGRVFAVDSNARAVECTRTTAQLNGLENVMVTLDDQAQCDAPGEFDIALGNPPYFSGNRIAEIFVDGAARALKPRGLAMFVTKSPDWFVESMCERFVELRVVSHRGYAVVMGRKL